MILAILLATADTLGVTAALPDRCASSDPNEVVVCGSRDKSQRYRLPKLSDKYEAGPVRAERELAPGVHARAHVDSVTMPDGAQSNRAMVTLTFKF